LEPWKKKERKQTEMTRQISVKLDGHQKIDVSNSNPTV